MCLSELGLLVKSCLDQGQLVPDDVISRLILKDLRALENSSWLLDGGSPCFGHKHVAVVIIITDEVRSVREQVMCFWQCSVGKVVFLAPHLCHSNI